MKFKDEHKHLIDFANYINENIKKMLFEDKTSSNMIVGLLQQQIYNIHRTMEDNPKLVKEITEKNFPEQSKGDLK